MILPEVLLYAHAALHWGDGGGYKRAGRRFRDRRGRKLRLGEWVPEDWDGLLAFYRSLHPTLRSQGIPPASEERRVQWLDALLRRAPSVVARIDRHRIAGHAVLLPDGGTTYKLLIFVHQEEQGAGIGRALVGEALALARRQGAERVWVSVARGNGPALALCRRLGFERSSAYGMDEEVWALSLRGDSSRIAAPRTVAAASTAVRRLTRWRRPEEASVR